MKLAVAGTGGAMKFAAACATGGARVVSAALRGSESASACAAAWDAAR